MAAVYNQCRFLLAFIAFVAVAYTGQGQELPNWVQQFYSPSSDQHDIKNSSTEAQRLFVLLVGDTDDPDAHRLGIDNDVEHLRKLFEDSFRDSGNWKRLQVTIKKGKDASRASIDEYFEHLKGESTSNDSICFYFSGHGQIDPARWKQWDGKPIPLSSNLGYDQDVCNLLLLRHGSVYISDIKTWMAGCKSQLRVILTDCCLTNSTSKPRPKIDPLEHPLAAIGPPPGPVSPEYADTGPIESMRPIWSLVRDAFLRHVGWVSIASTVRGNPSLGVRQGGVFTTALLRTFYGLARYNDETIQMPITWLEIWDPAVTTRVDQHGAIEAINSQRTETYSIGTCLVPTNGIGAALNVSSQQLEISNIAPDLSITSPAEAAGLIVGDRIVSVDSHQTSDLKSFLVAVSHKRSVEIEVVRGANTLRQTVLLPFDEDYAPFTPKQSPKP